MYSNFSQRVKESLRSHCRAFMAEWRPIYHTQIIIYFKNTHTFTGSKYPLLIVNFIIGIDLILYKLLNKKNYLTLS